MSYDLFISYSRRDNQEGRITQLVDRIKQDFAEFAHRDLVTFFDQHEIHGMQDWRQRILQGLRESHLLLACLSPTYLKSEYCEWEMVEYLKYEVGHLHGFNGVAPIYYVQVPGWDDKDFGQHCAAWVAELRRRQNFDLRPWSQEGEQALQEAAVRELSATLAPTLERLVPAERLALEFAALLPPDQVPLPWLRALVGKNFPEMQDDAEPGYPDPWKSLLRSLLSLRLFQATDVVDDEQQPRVVRVHRLVQQLMLLGCTAPQREAMQQALDALITERDAALENTTSWTTAVWELEPLTALAELWDEGSNPRAAWLLNQMGQSWQTIAQWGQAEPLMRRALAIDERSYGPDHPNVARDLNTLAQLLQATNRLGEAEPLMRRALAIDEHSFGPDHPDVATDLNNLALLLRATNRLGEAEPLCRRALAIDERSFGPDHPKVAIRLNNLAQLLQATNRLGEAEPLMRRALAIDERSYGPDLPLVAIRLNNLALLLQATNRLGEAEPLMRRALDIFEKSYGPDHPNLEIVRSNYLGLLEELILANSEIERKIADILKGR